MRRSEIAGAVQGSSHPGMLLQQKLGGGLCNSHGAKAGGKGTGDVARRVSFMAIAIRPDVQ